MTDDLLAQWYEAACARWAHLPEGEEREQCVRRTFKRIREEAELLEVAPQLPALDQSERIALLEEAHLDVFYRYGYPQTDDEQPMYDARVDELFHRLCLQAREQKAPVRVRARLIARRIARRWGLA